MMHAIFRGLCPNCGGDITDDRLLAGLPCAECLPDIKEASELTNLFKSSPLDFELKLGELLEARGKLMGLRDYVVLARKLRDFEDFFSKVTGKRMWSAQRTWAKRVLSGLSFAIIAPTGVGKTLFAVTLTLYYAKQGKKTLFILPTIVLANQVYEWLRKYAENTMLDVRIIPLFGGHVKDKEGAFDAIKKGQVDVVITTPMSLAKNFDRMVGAKFDLVAVDDVDALLRRSKNIDRVLNLMGFSQETVDLAMKLIKERAKLLGLLNIGRKEKIEEFRVKLDEVSAKLESLLVNNYGQLIVLSATGRARGLRVKLFRELLGFEAGTIVEYMRNIQDCYLLVEGNKPEDLMRPVLDLVKKLGSGGLIYVSHDLGADFAQALTDYLVSNGIRAAFAKAGMRGIRKLIEDFAKGELEVLVGVASYYGVIVRGLDLPERVRYALFAAVPKFKFTLDSEESHPIRLLQIMSVLQTIVEGDEAFRLARMVADMRRQALRLGYEEARLVADALRKGVKLEGYLEEVRQLFANARELMNELLKREEVKKKFLESPAIDVREIDGKLYMFIPDVMTYIQASGRTSRMYTGGLTKGLSIVVYLPQDGNALNNLIKQTRIYIDDVQWKSLLEINLEGLLREIDGDRARVMKALAGEIEEIKEPVKSALMIVESPTKARTIANFFGRPSRRVIGPLRVFEVFAGNFLLSIIATRGHIYDLVMEDIGRYGVLLLDNRFIPIYSTLKRCRKCGYQFTLEDSKVCLKCGSSSLVKSDDVVRALRKIASEIDLAFIATDPDVEGEKIGWDVACTIAPYLSEVKRSEFHEVTRRAIYEALNNPRDISISMIEAQLVRRIEDRWIGFSLSERLWDVFGKKWLAAGRVQTPVLGWIIERCEEWKRNITNYVIVDVEGGFRLYFDVPLSFKEVRELQPKIKDSEVVVEEVALEEVEVNPPPPFTTDELLYVASTKGFTSAEAMRIAQELFEMGFITYHRTDGTTVSDVGKTIARDYLQEKYKDEYRNWFVPRDWFKEGAHECIRPTRPIDASTLQRLIMDGSITTIIPLTMRHYRLYDLIFRRFIASQMKKAVILKAKYTFSLEIDGVKYLTEQEGIIELKDPGFYDVLGYKLLNKLNKGDKCKVENVEVRRTSRVPLYREGDVVRLMRERGIGRPSTYSKIIEGLIKHGYVVKNKWGGLIATAQGKEVYKYLAGKFEKLVSEETTKNLEEKMALIEMGKLNYQSVLRNLADQVDELLKGVEKIEPFSR